MPAVFWLGFFLYVWLTVDFCMRGEGTHDGIWGTLPCPVHPHSLSVLAQGPQLDGVTLLCVVEVQLGR